MSIPQSLGAGTPALTIRDFQRDGTIVSPAANKGIAFVLFYIPYCRFCADMAAAVGVFGAQHTGTVRIVGVDVTSSPNRGIMTYLGPAPFPLAAFPTVIIYYNGYPCSVYQRGVSPATDEVAQLNSALSVAQQGCGSCTLSSCRV